MGNAKICFNIKIDLTEIKAGLLKEGLTPGTKEYELKLLKSELAVIKDNYGAERSQAKSVSFGILFGTSA